MLFSYGKVTRSYHQPAKYLTVVNYPMDVFFKKYDSLKFHISQLGSLHILNSGSYYLYSCQLQQEFLPLTTL